MLRCAPMTARLIDGKAIAQRLREEVRMGVDAFVQKVGRAPGLDVVLVGEDPASVIYTRNKQKASTDVGIRSRLHRLPTDTDESKLVEMIQALNSDMSVDGILVQLPLPKHIDEQRILDMILPQKDVDGFHPFNVGLLSLGRGSLVPCTPRGCMRLIASTGLSLVSARAVVVGRSNIVGKPMAQLLLAANATVTIAHSRTRDLPSLCREADVLVVAIGRAHTVRGDWIKRGAVVLDVGTNRAEGNKLVGDVDTESAKERAAWISPVPGGVGPMTIACLLENTLAAARVREKLT